MTLYTIITLAVGLAMDAFAVSICQGLRMQKINIKGASRLKKFGIIRTMPYPGFPTDSQADFAVMASVARGTCTIVENIFENRFKYVHQLRKMGADINVDNKNEITILGVPELAGANVEATDLRAGAALVVAGLCAKGETLISEIGHIDRGYEYLVEKITKLGGKIERVKY